MLSLADRWIVEFDRALRTLSGVAHPSRPSPAAGEDLTDLVPEERTKSGALMRVDHSGEVCAQALYSGQALTARDPAKRDALLQAAREEGDHLAWTRDRLRELGTHQSLLNPLWYAGSFTLGAVAGLAGDRWSLGFVVETERQVEAHLDRHLGELPANDTRSRVILEQMRLDEIRHARDAVSRGAAKLPLPIATAMRFTAKVMTGSAYWV
ncbi:MAG: 2-polyprenyl-3-methyl-6-methoxy-1,4-benzoquinone monooxygenase [bacterium]|jgi:ubiquinone biosynthesis monooxygenase Coq7|nr:2-polyprenyl-3-methyl-6-methoxy-1,4-benzoquinone monooxygenase [Betaproteobacteria bacterium]